MQLHYDLALRHILWLHVICCGSPPSLDCVFVLLDGDTFARLRRTPPLPLTYSYVTSLLLCYNFPLSLSALSYPLP